jgi:hypothetical protein
MTLKSLTGATSLFSANLASYMPGGPTNSIDWVTTNLSGVNLSTYTLNMPAATLSVLVITPKPRLGDFNEDGSVDGQDLSFWKASFRKISGATHQQGDVDGADFLTWQQQVGSRFGLPASVATSAAIPEPSPAAFALSATMAAMYITRGWQGN